MALLLGLHFGAEAAGNSLQAVFSVMDDAAAKFKGLKADMKMVTHTAVINEDSVDNGTIVVKQPKPHDLRLLLDFREPDKKTVQMAGSKVDIYYPNNNTVQEYDLNKSHRDKADQFMLLKFGSNSKDLQAAYNITLGGPETVAAEPATRIELVPKSPDLRAQFPKFELWISEKTGIAVQQKMYQPGGDYWMATYSNMQLNPNLPDSAVTLNLPKGVHKEYPQR
jgi:outer membrane lipoprotein-sorting protein